MLFFDMAVVILFSVSANSAVVQKKSRNPPPAKKTDSKSEMTNSVVLGKTRFRFSLVQKLMIKKYFQTVYSFN